MFSQGVFVLRLLRSVDGSVHRAAMGRTELAERRAGCAITLGKRGQAAAHRRHSTSSVDLKSFPPPYPHTIS